MVRKSRLLKHERATREGRDQEVMKEIFQINMARLKAQARGETPPAEHPRSRDPRLAETFFGSHTVAGDAGETVQELFE
jgi:hypothetical protein